MGKSVNISASIIAFNEEANIGACLDSIQRVADEILVVDSFSTDKTVEICEARGVRLLKHEFKGHVEQKNFAMSQTRYDCILSLDADEALSPELRRSVLATKHNWNFDAYKVNRLTNYCGAWIRHCGWYPDTKIRLWDRNKGQWGGINPHDRVVMDRGASTGRLAGDLFHYSYHSLSQHISHVNDFSAIASRAAFEQGRKANTIADIVYNPFLTFLKKYFLQLGICDGYYGFVISVISGFGKFLKYAKLKELSSRTGCKHRGNG